MHNAIVIWILKKKWSIEIGPDGPQLNRYISDSSPGKILVNFFFLKSRHIKALEYTMKPFDLILLNLTPLMTGQLLTLHRAPPTRQGMRQLSYEIFCEGDPLFSQRVYAVRFSMTMSYFQRLAIIYIMYICMYGHMHVLHPCITYVYVCMYICLHVCVRLCMYACRFRCVCMYVFYLAFTT